VIDDIKGTMLAMAFVKVRSAGYRLRVAKMDGISAAEPTEKKDDLRINVNVINGLVKAAWIG